MNWIERYASWINHEDGWDEGLASGERDRMHLTFMQYKTSERRTAYHSPEWRAVMCQIEAKINILSDIQGERNNG